jgi:DNA-binding NarL/FixJ family response regulator
MHQTLKSAPKGISVLVSESTRMGAQLLADALRKPEYRFVVAGCAVRSSELLKALADKKPRTALISAQLEDGSQAGFDVLRQVGTLSPQTRCILLVESSEPETVVNAFRCGAKGIFCRTQSFDTLCKCIFAVSKGQIWASSAELQFVLEELSRSAPAQGVNGRSRVQLSGREEEVVDLVAQGLTNREISGKLHLSAHTVKNYLFRIFEKLGVSSRVALVLHALDRKEPRAALPEKALPKPSPEPPHGRSRAASA